jgi:hypothetical protein
MALTGILTFKHRSGSWLEPAAPATGARVQEAVKLGQRESQYAGTNLGGNDEQP